MTMPVRRRAERSEVRRSRAAILAAAERHWSVQDADPSMLELATMAGVGSATLYRRFPNIDAIVIELHERLVAEFERIAEVVAAQPTAWDSIVALVMGIIDVLQEHPALPRLNRRMVAMGDDRLSTGWEEPLEDLVARAKAEGTLRQDVNSNDITFAAFRIGSYSNLPPAEAGRILGRQVGIVFDGLRADDRKTTLPGKPVSMTDLRGIFQHEVDHPVD
jgi:AcrR family transcriptional regulator